MRFKTFTFATISAAMFTGRTALAHFDVKPYVSSAKIVTGGHDDATNEDLPIVRVFGYDFAEDPNDPYFAQDPGFNAPAGCGLPGGSQLSFNLLGSLSYWNGSGSPSFGALPSSESLRFNFGAQDRTVTAGSGFQTGFSLQTVNADGSMHRHLNSFLQGSDGNSIPAADGPWGAGDGIQAADGIYLLSMQLTNSDAGTASSDPFWIVFNNGVPEQIHDEAIDFVQSNIVPEPASIGAMGLLIAAGVSRRSRRRRNTD